MDNVENNGELNNSNLPNSPQNGGKKNDADKMADISMYLGIAACALILFVPKIAVLLGICAIIFAIISKVNGGDFGKAAKIGLYCGVIALVLSASFPIVSNVYQFLKSIVSTILGVIRQFSH